MATTFTATSTFRPMSLQERAMLEQTSGPSTPAWTSPIYAATEQERAAHRRDMNRQAGISAALAGAQLLAEVVPTAQDAENRRQIKELRRLKAAGDLGLTGSERQMAVAERMNPVAAFAREARLDREGAIAAQGGTRSAADVTRLTREEDRTIASAAYQAGADIDTMHRQKVAEQLAELDSRIASRGQRQGEVLQAVAERTGQVAGEVGAIEAGRSTKMDDLSNLTARFGDVQAKAIYDRVLKIRDPAKRKAAMDMLLGYGPNQMVTDPAFAGR